MTAAFSMGLPFTSFTIVISMRAVGGGALYLRPRLEVSSWPWAANEKTTRPNPATRTVKRNKERRNMASIVARFTPYAEPDPRFCSGSVWISIYLVQEVSKEDS